MAWNIADSNGQVTKVDDKIRLQALSLVNDCYKFRMELLTNSSIIGEAVKFVEHSKSKLLLSSNNRSNDKSQQQLHVNTNREDILKMIQQEEAHSTAKTQQTTNRTF